MNPRGREVVSPREHQRERKGEDDGSDEEAKTPVGQQQRRQQHLCRLKHDERGGQVGSRHVQDVAALQFGEKRKRPAHAQEYRLLRVQRSSRAYPAPDPSGVQERYQPARSGIDASTRLRSGNHAPVFFGYRTEKDPPERV
jgi:hypothetical protein